MRFAFTEEQILFRDSVRGLLDKACTPSALRAAWDSDIRSEVWITRLQQKEYFSEHKNGLHDYFDVLSLNCD